MTACEKIEAMEQKERMYNQARGRCKYCNKALTFGDAQLAHRIPKHKKYLKKYGAVIIHHPLNMVITCDKCNSKALLDPATNPIQATELVEEMWQDMER